MTTNQQQQQQQQPEPKTTSTIMPTRSHRLSKVTLFFLLLLRGEKGDDSPGYYSEIFVSWCASYYY